jgi:hypothetical protein
MNGRKNRMNGSFLRMNGKRNFRFAPICAQRKAGKRKGRKKGKAKEGKPFFPFSVEAFR